jgi:CRISPR-associated protein Csx17
MAAYLKALAVLRLVSEQTDAEAKGCWQGNMFCVESKLDEPGLVRFFLEEYRPTPIVAPWNGGSGFHEGDRRVGMDAILSSDAVRFEEYRETILAVRAFPEMPKRGLSLLEMRRRVKTAAKGRSGKAAADLNKLVAETGNCLRSAMGHGRSAKEALRLSFEEIEKLNDSFGKKTEPAKRLADLARAVRKLRSAAKKLSREAGKEGIIGACRNRLCDRAGNWIDAAVVLTSDKPACPPILGTGGIE